MTDPTPPGDGLTDAARLMVEAAAADAAALDHSFVGTEHLLLALLADPELAAHAQSIRPVPSRDELRERLRGVSAPRGLRQGEGEGPALSPQARRLLSALDQEAVEAGRQGVDRRQLLERILATPRGPLGRLLAPEEPGAPERARDKRGLAEPAEPRAPAASGDPAPAVVTPDTPPKPQEPPADQAKTDRDEGRRGSRGERRERGGGEAREERRQKRGAREPGPTAEDSGEGPAPREGGRESGREKGRRSREADRAEGEKGRDKGARSKGRDRDRRKDAPLPAPKRDRPVPPPKPPRAPAREPIRLPWRVLLLVAVPASWVLAWLEVHPGLLFLVAAVGVIPLAGYMGEATEHLATRTGPAFGGLMNATFGNAAELIIAVVALRAGLVGLVKASIIGSILGNLLLIAGLSIIAAGMGRGVVGFNRTGAAASSGMLALAMIGLVFPALFHGLHPEAGFAAELGLSEAVAIVLAVTYLFSLVFTFRTHRALFSGDPHPTAGTIWRVPVALGVLLVATAAVVVQSELLVGATRYVVDTMGVSEVFLGLVVIPVIGNAAEHASAVVVARKGNLDLAMQISLGSSTQIALLVAPVLVVVGVLMGQPMDLVFTPFEVTAVAVSTIIAAIITADGETHWFEGVQLLATFALFAVTAWVI